MPKHLKSLVLDLHRDPRDEFQIYPSIFYDTDNDETQPVTVGRQPTGASVRVMRNPRVVRYKGII